MITQDYADMIKEAVVQKQHRKAIELLKAIPDHRSLAPTCMLISLCYLSLYEIQHACKWMDLTLKNKVPENEAFKFHSNAAIVYSKSGNRGRLQAAERHFQLAIERSPNAIERVTTRRNYASFLERRQRYTSASEQFMAILNDDPTDSLVWLALAGIAFRGGDYQTSWALYQRRHDDFIAQSPWPRWNGELRTDDGSLPRKLLIRTEQGHGDVFQFLRYVKCVTPQFDEVHIHAPSSMYQFLTWCDWPSNVTIRNGEVNIREHFDYYCLLIDIPNIMLQYHGEMLFRGIPYFKNLYSKSAYTNIGFAWCGNPDHGNDWERSLPPRALSPLMNVFANKLYSFQVGERENEYPELLPLKEYGYINDWSDTTRELMRMRLFITVDTAVAHLAGTLGVPTWLILPTEYREWRWGDSGETTPWYPSMRIWDVRNYRNLDHMIGVMKNEIDQGI